MVVDQIEKIEDLKKLLYRDSADPFIVCARDRCWKRNCEEIEKRFKNRKRFNYSFFTDYGYFIRFYFNLKDGVYKWKYIYEYDY